MFTDGTPASLVASATFGEVGLVSNQVTGGDFHPDGNEFSFRTYTHIYTVCGADPAAAFQGDRRAVIGTRLFQSETLTYTRDGAFMLTTSEQQRNEQPPILKMTADSTMR